MRTPSNMTVSVVTPSFNQGEFLEEAICSVLGQQHAAVEYVVIDGGSTDGSVDTIKKYAHRLAYWVSEKDGGQYDALNKGFSKTTGEIMAWLNSDDKYMPSALATVVDIFSTHPQIEWITTVHPLTWNSKGQPVKVDFTGGFNSHAFYRGSNLPVNGSHGRRWIQQESTFWRRSLWKRAGGRLDSRFEHAADFELWARFFQHAELYGVCALLGGFREHGKQKSAQFREAYLSEAQTVLTSYRQWPCRPVKRFLKEALWKLVRQYSLTPLPTWVRCAARRFSFLYPTQVLVWGGAEWECVSGFIV
jgi:glycosyltransferase involved in cell wall biosynthesis